MSVSRVTLSNSVRTELRLGGTETGAWLPILERTERERRGARRSDVRRLYLGEGYSSLFTYCTRVLHLSEHAAYARIEAARAARRFPVLLELLAEGAITLTTVTLLSSHLTPANHCAVLAAAKHRSKREVEQLAASLRPRPDVPATIRKLPEPTCVTVNSPRPAAPAEAAAQTNMNRDGSEQPSVATISTRPSTVLPLSPRLYRIQFTASVETHDKLRRAQDLLRHVVPDGDVAAILDRALTLLVRELERRKLAADDRPRAYRARAAGHRHREPAGRGRTMNGRPALVRPEFDRRDAHRDPRRHLRRRGRPPRT